MRRGNHLASRRAALVSYLFIFAFPRLQVNRQRRSQRYGAAYPADMPATFFRADLIRPADMPMVKMLANSCHRGVPGRRDALMHR
jgi:hypothetical protein